MEKTIKLDCYGIVIELTGDGGGSIISDLHETETKPFYSAEELDSEIKRQVFIDGIEALILGHACAGIDITTPAYLEGIESAVQGCADNIY